MKILKNMKKINVLVRTYYGTVQCDGTLNNNNISFSLGETSTEIVVRGEIPSNVTIAVIFPNMYSGDKLVVGNKTYKLECECQGNRVGAVAVEGD